MTDRAYTVKEIDDFLNVLRRRYMWGTTYSEPYIDGLTSSQRQGRTYNETELEKFVGVQLHTYMNAGVTAEAIIEEDRIVGEKWFRYY